ncbi:MAG: precorrin-6Y C5,15-methyltransferase (decarboxylating) subunit CbiT [Candidatus Melainabacteria bacterium GWF2_37_15]|nr:MAG: precorrin-6Y C5,15-methyltransferase (decarboxylating) subunit CbiT [Candidatus Melainabacteria bacterium GWF2_37_15]
MLTIAGSGINDYSLQELSQKVCFSDFDCLIADVNFNTPANKELISNSVQVKFLSCKDIKPFILENTIKKVLYVVTGSPLFFSAAQVIMKDIKDVNLIPAESSKDYFLKKLGIAENEVTSLSLHGRESVDLTKFLTTKYTFVLCDKDSIEKLSELTYYIKDDLIFYLGSKLGSVDERIETVNLYDINAEACVPYVLLIEKKFSSINEGFETNAGMITKADKRVLTIQALELEPNMTMWDIGAGSGSVSIEAYKFFKINTVLFEKNEAQCRFIKKNLSNHKVASAKLSEGDVLENYENQPKPDRIFIGGGGEAVLSRIKLFYDELKDNGILVANIIGMENLTEALSSLKNSDLTYEIRRIDLTYYKKISENIQLSIPEPERSLYQLILRK